MNIINRRVSLLVTVVFLNTTVFANTGANFRPAGRAAAPEQSTVPGAISSAADAAAKARATTAFESVPALKAVSTDARAIILDRFTTNKMIRVLYNGIAQQTISSGNDPIINEMIATKLEIAAVISDMDIENPAVESNMSRDVNVQAQYIMGNLISKINGGGMSVESRKTVLALYRAIKEQLEIQGAAHAQQVLANALADLGTVTGLNLTLEEVFFAVAAEKAAPGSLQSLFLSVNDVQLMKVGSLSGKELEVHISSAEVARISDQATKQFWDMIHIGENPGGAKQQQVQTGVNQIVASSAGNFAQQFIEGNDLLNRNEVALGHRDKAVAEVGDTYESLLGTLKEYGSVIDGNSLLGRAGRFLQDKPLVGGVGNWLNKKNDVALKKLTLKGKIQKVQKALEDGLRQIEKDNHSLNELRAKAREYQMQLEKESVRLKIMSDTYAVYIADLQTRDPQRAQTLNINVGQPLQREMNYVLTTLFTLKNSIASFDTTIMIGMTTIQDSEVIIRGLIPAMALTESQQSAIATQDAHIARQKAAQTLIQKRMLILSQMQIKSAEKAVAMAENSILDPKVLEEVRANNQKAIDIFRNGKSKAEEKLRNINQQLINSNNKAGLGSQDAGTAEAVNHILRNGKQ